MAENPERLEYAGVGVKSGKRDSTPGVNPPKLFAPSATQPATMGGR